MNPPQFISPCLQVYLVQVHRLLPIESKLSDPYDSANPSEISLGWGGRHQALEVLKESLALSTGRHSEEASYHELLGLELAAGQEFPAGVALKRSASGSIGLTVATWYKPRRSHSGPQCLAAPGRSWALVLQPSGTMGFVQRSTAVATPMEYRTLVVAPAAAWNHVAVTLSGRGGGNDISIYVNGTLVPHSVQHSKASIGMQVGQR